MTVVILIAIAAVLAILVGLLVFRLAKKMQTAVPEMTESSRPAGERVVGTDELGRDITEDQEPQEAPRDAGAFDGLLRDEMHDLGMKRPTADDEP